jgi:ABC-type tungstate transport system permease subunit
LRSATLCIIQYANFFLQVPWATAYSTWYHQYIAFPIQALTAAILLDEYTITDRGTILSLDAKLRNQTVIYKAGTDSADDPLLNPAHLLVGKKAPHAKTANDFAKWLVSKKGQDVVVGFKKDGQQLYSPAPSSNSTA